MVEMSALNEKPIQDDSVDTKMIWVNSEYCNHVRRV